jgi:hypothetical protein
MKIDNEEVLAQRVTQWLYLCSKEDLPEFDKDNMKILQKVHFDTIRNYTSNFGFALDAYYKTANIFTKITLYRVMNKSRIYSICDASKNRTEKDYISINEVFNLCKNLNLKKDFLGYFLNKTQMSMSLSVHQPIKAVVKKKIFEKRGVNRAIRDKMAQFIYSIMVEYIILHNLIWASSYKLSGIESLDLWVEDI